MPAIVFLFAGRFDRLRTGTPRSYRILFRRALARHHQGPVRRQPCGDMCMPRVIGDLRVNRSARFRTYPYQCVSIE